MGTGFLRKPDVSGRWRNRIAEQPEAKRPEDAYSEDRVLGLRSVIPKYSDELLLRQGENGAPSTYIPSFALSEYYWTEYTQAK